MEQLVIDETEEKQRIYQQASHALQVLYANMRGEFRWQAVGNIDGVCLMLSALGLVYNDLLIALVEEKWRIIKRGL